VAKLNLYRTCVGALLATAAYLWPVILYGLAVWFAGVVFSLALEKATTSEMKTATLFDPDPVGLLAAWRGLWNGFYVWKDVDQDYRLRGARAGDAETPLGSTGVERQADHAAPDA
jgi:hypothetical protein